MRKHARGSKTMVMLALLAVLLGSLGYLSMQGGREGMTPPKKQGFKVREGMTGQNEKKSTCTGK